LIRKNAGRERQIDDVSDSGKKDMRALFKHFKRDTYRNRIQITNSVRRLKEEYIEYSATAKQNAVERQFFE